MQKLKEARQKALSKVPAGFKTELLSQFQFKNMPLSFKNTEFLSFNKPYTCSLEFMVPAPTTVHNECEFDDAHFRRNQNFGDNNKCTREQPVTYNNVSGISIICDSISNLKIKE